MLAVEGLSFKVLPSFRPDKALNINLAGFAEYIAKLGEAAGIEIKTADDVIAALLNRVDYFDSVGCCISDQAFDYVPFEIMSDGEIEAAFETAMQGGEVTAHQADAYKTKILLALGAKYAQLAGLWKFISAL
jgi:glucuronate isomerase